jgi:putative sigma-54 modulation protein
MQTNITFKNIESSDALKEYALKRLSKLDKYIDRTAEAHVVFSVEKRRHKAEITLTADGTVINAEEITDDLYAAIDMVMDKLERQLKKYKGKLQVKKTPSKPATSAPAETPAPGRAAPRKKPRVVQEKDYDVKPMSIDDAVDEMNAGKLDFILFRNTSSKRLNLLYKRPDGELALIEPSV